MARVKRALDGRDAHIATLRLIILLLAGVIAYTLYGWSKAPERIVVDIPPDLRSGSTRSIDERHPYNVYAFALYMWQQLNNWPVSGDENYARNLNAFQCYMTPQFKAELERDRQARGSRSELKRTRALQEMYDRPYEAKRVWIESPESWVTYIDAALQETYEGQVVKDSFIRYPLRVVRYDVDGECNPFGLALDGFYQDPIRLEGRAQSDALAVN